MSLFFAAPIQCGMTVDSIMFTRYSTDTPCTFRGVSKISNYCRVDMLEAYFRTNPLRCISLQSTKKCGTLAWCENVAVPVTVPQGRLGSKGPTAAVTIDPSKYGGVGHWCRIPFFRTFVALASVTRTYEVAATSSFYSSFRPTKECKSATRKPKSRETQKDDPEEPCNAGTATNADHGNNATASIVEENLP